MSYRKRLAHLVDLLPYWCLAPYLKHRASKSRYSSLRKDIRQISVQNGVVFDVYWKIVPSVGKGVALCVYIHNRLVAKYDFFGRSRGHYHIVDGKNLDRDHVVHKLPEGSRQQQVNDLMENFVEQFEYVLSVNCRTDLKELEYDRDVLRAKADEAKEVLLKYLAHIEKN